MSTRLVVSETRFGPDRNDAIAQELLSGGKWKQALANVEKRLKKGKDDRLQASLGLELPHA